MNEIMRILIAYDDSEYARAAIEDLPRAGLPPEANALVVSVADVTLPPPSPELIENAARRDSRRVTALVAQVQAQATEGLKEAHAQATNGCKRVQSLFPEWRVEAATPAGTPSWEIIKQADEWGADLIVVGSQGRSALGRLIMGSVSTKIAHEAKRSVRIGRTAHAVHDESQTVPTRIVIGVDDTPGAQAVVAAVVRRMWMPGSQARVITVSNQVAASWGIGLVPEAKGLVAETYQEEKKLKERALEEAAAALRRAGLKVAAEMRTGDAQRVLLDEATRTGADCIFVGSRNLSGALERFTLGSVSSGIATNAACSVEIVKAR